MSENQQKEVVQNEKTAAEKTDVELQSTKGGGASQNKKNQPKKLNFQRWSELSRTRKIITAVFGLLFLWCLAPIFFGISGIGVMSSSFIMLFISAAAYCWNIVESARSLKMRAICIFIALLGSAGLIAFGIVSGLMIKASITTVPDDCRSYTVVVLGCKTIDDQPSWMLQDRLDKAYRELLKNPDVMCVVTGGQGDDELYSEAYVMKKYLTERGISADRIIMEDSSGNTEENMLYTKAVIELNGLSQNVVIVTDRFHELRARIWAEKAGFDNIYSACCDTRIYLVTGYWFREMFGLARLYVFGC
ncbi:MAG: YdcF family protein [Firmicutes bacterium]|nr:YdcF family protein [Bacillota bacterium]